MRGKTVNPSGQRIKVRSNKGIFHWELPVLSQQSIDLAVTLLRWTGQVNYCPYLQGDRIFDFRLLGSKNGFRLADRLLI